MILMGYERICFFSSIWAQFPRNLKIPHTCLFSFIGMQSWANFVNLDFSFLCLNFKIFILQSFLQFFGVLYCGEDFSLWTSGMIFIPFSLIVIEKFLCFLKKKQLILCERFTRFLLSHVDIYILSFGLQSLTKMSGFLSAISVWIALV